MEGKDDLCIIVISVILESGYYWDNKYGNFVVGVKMLIGVVIGKMLDDLIEGILNV